MRPKARNKGANEPLLLRLASILAKLVPLEDEEEKEALNVGSSLT